MQAVLAYKEWRLRHWAISNKKEQMLKIIIEKHFAFLSAYDNYLFEEDSECCVRCVGTINSILFEFSQYSLEITCRLISNDTNSYAFLQEVLDYWNIEGYRGIYQLSKRQDIEKGLLYLAEVLRMLFEKKKLSNPTVFQELIKDIEYRRKELLDAYYVKEDLKLADSLLEKEEFEKAITLYRKHFDYLSEVQRKKLEIIEKRTYY